MVNIMVRMVFMVVIIGGSSAKLRCERLHLIHVVGKGPQLVSQRVDAV